jgi:hypothetical protein
MKSAAHTIWERCASILPWRDKHPAVERVATHATPNTTFSMLAMVVALQGAVFVIPSISVQLVKIPSMGSKARQEKEHSSAPNQQWLLLRRRHDRRGAPGTAGLNVAVNEIDKRAGEERENKPERRAASAAAKTS